VSIVDEWVLRLPSRASHSTLRVGNRSLKRIPTGSRLSISSAPKSGWDGLKELVEAYQDADARHQAVRRIDSASRSQRPMRTGLARRAPARDTIDETRRPIHKVLVPGPQRPHCLCGSGKKFKHCHGALKLLH